MPEDVNSYNTDSMNWMRKKAADDLKAMEVRIMSNMEAMFKKYLGANDEPIQKRK